MIYRLYLVLFLFVAIFPGCRELKMKEANLTLTKPTLMHTLRETPYPSHQSVSVRNPAVLLWPEQEQYRGLVLDGAETDEVKKAKKFRVRLSQDPTFTNNVFSAETEWSFYCPFQTMESGTWFWQYQELGAPSEAWSETLSFTLDETAFQFNPPSYEQFSAKIPSYHPRILVDQNEWADFRTRNQEREERRWYLQKADQVLRLPLQHIDQVIDTSLIHLQDNEVKRKGYLIQQSRSIVDREEMNIEALVRAYLLTADRKYADAGIRRIKEVLSWQQSRCFAGDFNQSVLLNIATIGYDSFYGEMNDSDRQTFRQTIGQLAQHFYEEYVNHLENYIADNHVWQMTFRILINAAISVYGEVDGAAKWTEYAYKLWVARFPGLTDDGGWHNGDSYFHVHIRTLIEVPFLFSRISGFNFFSDPWYNKNVDYVIYQQPPFSKSAGHGNGHELVTKPSGVRVGYAYALAMECGNPFAMDYVRKIQSGDPDILQKAFLSKSGDLTWYRLATTKKWSENTTGLEELPRMKAFPETGLATMHTNLAHWDQNAMLSFRSSPYGSTSHALADQNGFNLFYGGEPLFYSSGHRLSFIDEHSMYAYRHTRAHNSILVNGWGQKIGTEGYGWIPRSYAGSRISYVAGDASEAYGEVTSWLWLERAQLSNIEYSEKNGWGPDLLKKFRRQVVMLGETGLFVIYDELEATQPASFSYLLHTIRQAPEIEQQESHISVRGMNERGTAAVSLFASAPCTASLDQKFFYPAVNFRGKTEAGGKMKEYGEHWHFSAVSDPQTTLRFLSVISVCGHPAQPEEPVLLDDGTIQIGEWIIEANLTGKGEAAFRILEKNGKTGIAYNRELRTKEIKILPRYKHSTLVFEYIDGQLHQEELIDQAPDGLII